MYKKEERSLQLCSKRQESIETGGRYTMERYNTNVQLDFPQPPSPEMQSGWHGTPVWLPPPGYQLPTSVTTEAGTNVHVMDQQLRQQAIVFLAKRLILENHQLKTDFNNLRNEYYNLQSKIESLIRQIFER